MPPFPTPLPGRTRRLACLLACLATITCAGTASAAPSVRASRAEVVRIEGQLARLDARVGEVAAANNAAVDRLEAVTANLLRARRHLATTERDLQRGRERLSARLRGMYAMGTPSEAELLLTSGSIAAAVDVRELMDRIAAEDGQTITTLRTERIQVVALKAELTDRQRAAEQRTRELAARRAELDAAVAARERVLRSARKELRAAIAAERARQRQLAAEAAARKAQAMSTMPYLTSAAELAVLPGGVSHIFPVQGGAHYSDDWLYARPGGRVHQGIDLFADTGTPLVAVADGTVFRVGYNGLGGWRLWLRDSAGTEFYYAHMSAYAPAAQEGATVTRGTVLGFVGTSGDAQGTSPHCHFEIHPGGGGPVRPYPIVSAWPTVG